MNFSYFRKGTNLLESVVCKSFQKKLIDGLADCEYSDEYNKRG